MHSQLDSNLPQYLISHVKGAVDIYASMLFVNTLAVLFFQIPINYYLQRYSKRFSIIIGCSFLSLAFLLFSLSISTAGFLFGMLIYVVGEMIIFPLNTILIDQMAIEERKGVAFGIGNFSLIGFGLGPTLGGWLITYFNSQKFFTVMIIFPMLALILYYASILIFESRNRLIESYSQ